MFGLFLKRQVFFFPEPKGFSVNITLEAQASCLVKKTIDFSAGRKICVLWCATLPHTHLIGRSHPGTSHSPCYGPEYLSCTPGKSRGPALDEAGRPGTQEPTQQRGLQAACRVGCEGKTLGGGKVGALHCSVQPVGSWEPSAGFLAPTSLASPSALLTHPALHVPTPLPCLRPGSFQSTMSSGHTWHVVQGSPCGPCSSDWPLVLLLPQDQGLRVCYAPET